MENWSRIRMSEINERKYLLKNKTIGVVPQSQINRINESADFQLLEYFVNQISKTTGDSEKYSISVLNAIDNSDNPDEVKDTLYKKMSKNALTKLNPEFIKDIDKHKSEHSFMSSDVVRNKVSDLMIIDRILKNDESLSKRFNIDKVITNNSKGDVEDLIKELCTLIDTYQLSNEAKFNVALENITYSMSKNHVNVSDSTIMNTITEYFIESNPILTDRDINGLYKVLENNRIIDNSDSIYIDYIREFSSDNYYKKKINKLSSSSDSEDVKKFILSVLKIKNERQASIYINKAIKAVYKSNKSDMTNKDIKNIMTSIYMIPLIGNVSRAFVNTEINLNKTKYNYMTMIEDEEFIELMKDALDDEDDLMLNARVCEHVVVDKEEEPSIYFIESEHMADSNDIKDILNKFKTEQEKSVGKFKSVLSRIYRKSPENIIDETPSILSIVRVVFILGTFTIPVVGPIVGVVSYFIDHMISTKINENQVKKLITSLKNEKKLVEEKIEKNDEHKSDLQQYLKCLDKCIDKCKDYQSRLTDEVDDDDTDDSDDLDFGDDLDFEFESTRLVAMSGMMTTIMETYADNNFKKVITECIPSELIKEDTTLYREYISLVNQTGIYDISNIGAYLKENVEMTVMEATAALYVNTNTIETDNEDERLIYQYEAVNALRGIYDEYITYNTIHESDNDDKKKKSGGINLNTLKLAIQSFKGKVKDLSTKEKAMWRSLDATMSGFMNSIQKSLTSDRREAIIKGSIIPSFSKCLKTAFVVGTATFINPIFGLITAMGIYGTSKKLNNKERQLIYDEIDTELKIVEKEIQLADNDGDMKKYRFMLQYQKKLLREKQRIKYGLKVQGRNIPDANYKED